MNNNLLPVRIAFFGSSRFSVIVLDELEKIGILPSCVVTTPDKPQGRKLEITPNPVKSWAQIRNILVLDPAKLDSTFTAFLKQEECGIFLVASYGKIIPKDIIDLPEHKTLNIHPSLLPTYRGASPLQSAMLDDRKETGITIMQIDEEMDHGPIVAQKPVHVDEWPTYEVFEEIMAKEGARLLAEVLPKWIDGKITAQHQDHTAATYTKKIAKEDGLINLADDSYLNFRKVQAYHEWPQAYFMIEERRREKGEGRKLRVKITQASFKEGKLIIEKVIPEGKKEMSYKDFQAGYLKNAQ